MLQSCTSNCPNLVSVLSRADLWNGFFVVRSSLVMHRDVNSGGYPPSAAGPALFALPAAPHSLSTLHDSVVANDETAQVEEEALDYADEAPLGTGNVDRN